MPRYTRLFHWSNVTAQQDYVLKTNKDRNGTGVPAHPVTHDKLSLLLLGHRNNFAHLRYSLRRIELFLFRAIRLDFCRTCTISMYSILLIRTVMYI
jgi:hypothetical protein